VGGASCGSYDIPTHDSPPEVCGLGTEAHTRAGTGDRRPQAGQIAATLCAHDTIGANTSIIQIIPAAEWSAVFYLVDTCEDASNFLGYPHSSEDREVGRETAIESVEGDHNGEEHDNTENSRSPSPEGPLGGVGALLPVRWLCLGISARSLPPRAVGPAGAARTTVPPVWRSLRDRARYRRRSVPRA
jgi:hypothetical protein